VSRALAFGNNWVVRMVMADEVRIMQVIGEEERIIFSWEAPSDYPRHLSERGDDVAEAYCVTSCERASSGIVVYARWDGKWEANPWSTRPLIAHLLDVLQRATGPAPAHSY